MTSWLFDTLVWTAALIAIVLVLRRPVARAFGPQLAYALWLLPMLRLAFPPITLPAWMAPEVPEVPGPADEVIVSLTFEPMAMSQLPPEPAFDWTGLIPFAVTLWLVGAALFLLRRFKAYHDIRRELLDGAREVGREGRIRLIESPATNGPIALGVRDRIVALPLGFMAQQDVRARNLALRHEIAHHQGHDLLVNMLVQPLFALHWFNPLGTLGWLALRRDQEAACDARVISASAPEERATYANVIASFAAGPNLALAAPMACPVLGDKSIIHRLRSLKMNDHSTRRRLAGRGLIAAAAIALPLTASVTYAEVTASAAPEVPLAPQAPSAPPPPPAPPAPAAPEAPLIGLQSAADASDAEVERKIERHVFVIRDEEAGDDRKDVKKIRKVRVHQSGEGMSKEEMDKVMAEVHASLAQADHAIAEAHAHAAGAAAEAGRHHVTVEMSCEGDDAASSEQSADGKRVVRICKTEIMASAVEGLREAVREIEAEENIPGEMRERILKALKARIREWESREG